MSFLEIIDTLLLRSLELVFEVAYMLAYRIIDNRGLSIIVLSLLINFLVLPLYIRADAIQEEQHAIEKKLQKGADHIKRTFRGDERMMLLQTYYRQNHYKPVYVLRGAVSLFLQIPFFIAAYRFLSGLQLLNGVSFGPIADLGKADGMLQLAGISVNVLPVIMTAVNLISCIIFTKGSPLRSKIQLYAMALFFLVFLYASPAGLVFYWTLNNVFSLVKTCFYKLKNPVKAVRGICSIAGVLLTAYGVFFYQFTYNVVKRKLFLAGIGVLLQIPLLYKAAKSRIRKKEKQVVENRKMFFAGTLFLAVLTGALIPSAVIKASPQEFVDVIYFYHPSWFVVSSFCMAAGLFVIWAGVFYYLAKPSGRVYFDKAAWILSGIAIVDYMLFGKNLGNLNSHLKFDNELLYSGKDMLINTAVLLGVLLVFYIIYRKWARFATEILITGVLAFSVMTIVNITGINTSIGNMKGIEREENTPGFELSRTGKNVIVLMLDRAMGEYIPYIFRDIPELEEKFSGFTYYANMVSFGISTNFSVPSLFGGYEYTPVELNRRSTDTLAEKHNEALKVLPVLFDQNDYEVTVCDPPYAGYQWTPDLSIYDAYPKIRTYITEGRLTDPLLTEQGIRNNNRNFFCYSVFKVIPVCLQKFAYDKGRYNQTEMEISYSGQVQDSHYTATGLYAWFMRSYNVLEALPEITKPVNEEKNTFLVMGNSTTHYPALLQEPDYVPAVTVDNTEYGKDYQERLTIDGQVLKVETDMQLIHYHSNVAALLKLGEWFDYLREENVYDNTKIILVSDHGIRLSQLEKLILEDGTDIGGNYALLMMKDFDSSGFKTSEELMTCADVPTLAVEDVIENPVNPFTGKKIENSDKETQELYIIDSLENDILKNNGTQFKAARWYTVRDDMRKPENWKLLSVEETILPSVDRKSEKKE